MLNKTFLKKELETELLGMVIWDITYLLGIVSKLDPEELEKENLGIYSVFMNLSEPLPEQDLLIEILKSEDIEYNKYRMAASKIVVTEIIVDYKLKEYLDVCLGIKAERILLQGLQTLKNEKLGLDTIVDINEQLSGFLDVVNIFKKELSLYQLHDSIINKIEQERNNPKLNNSIFSSKFSSFNKATEGIKPGNIVTISGAYKQGKTNFGLQLLLDFAINSGINVGIFSLEMSEDELNKKCLGIKSGVNNSKLRNPQNLTNSDLKNLKLSKKVFNNGQIYICDKTVNEVQIKTRAKAWQKKFGVKVILIDYIGLVESTIKSRKGDTREREIAHLSRYFKNMAKELNISIIQLAQLNREGIYNPKSSNLAESIAIARDSDFIFSIFKPVDAGNQIISFEGKNVKMKDNNFVVTLNNSRHTKSNVSFLLEMSETGEFQEIEVAN